MWAIANRKASGCAFGPAAAAGCSGGPGDDRKQDPDVADVEGELQQGVQVAARHDGHDADERGGDAQRLDGFQALAVKRPGQCDDDDGNEGIEQQAVDGFGLLQADVGQRVVEAGAEDAEHHEPAPTGQEHGAVALEVGPGQR
jgi:hypothetical protein